LVSLRQQHGHHAHFRSDQVEIDQAEDASHQGMAKPDGRAFGRHDSQTESRLTGRASSPQGLPRDRIAEHDREDGEQVNDQQTRSGAGAGAGRDR
jgi:hypothetical protein